MITRYTVVGRITGMRAGKTLAVNTDNDRLMAFIKERLRICSPSADMHNWAYGWPASCHLDILEMADMKK